MSVYLSQTNENIQGEKYSKVTTQTIREEEEKIRTADAIIDSQRHLLALEAIPLCDEDVRLGVLAGSEVRVRRRGCDRGGRETEKDGGCDGGLHCGSLQG